MAARCPSLRGEAADREQQAHQLLRMHGITGFVQGVEDERCRGFAEFEQDLARANTARFATAAALDHEPHHVFVGEALQCRVGHQRVRTGHGDGFRGVMAQHEERAIGLLGVIVIPEFPRKVISP